jgi:ribonuclease D
MNDQRSLDPHTLIPRAIAREEIAALPIRRYDGEVSLVATSAEIERAMEDIRGESVVGFDTETRPAFKKGESHLPCLIQVATARRVHLFQLSRLDCSAAAAELLHSPAIVKAGVGLKYDLGQLKLLFPFEPAGVVDLGEVAKQHGLQQSGVRNLAGLFLGFRIPKGARTSNWAAPRLSEQQIRYAATDAWACRELYLRFADLGMLGSPAGPAS